MAATSTISVANATTTPEQAVPVDLTFSGTNGSTGNATVDAVVRPAGGLGCQSRLGYTTQTDQQLNLYSVLLPVGTTSAQTCADSFELQQQQEQTETVLLGVGAASVFGGPTSTTAISKQKTGLYTVCTWLEGPNAQEVDKAVSTPITVGTPVAPAPPEPGLKLTAVKASQRHGLSVSGSTAAGFTGRLLVSAACGSSTAKRTATAKRRRFSPTFGLPRGCRVGRKVKLSVSWAGSGSWSKQSAGRSVAVRR
jgi:hypothetical protein